MSRARQVLRDAASWSRRPWIIDATILFNEIDLLEIRLHELDAHVDRFVVVEGNLTFAGEAKPWFFPEYRARFAAFADRIVYHQVDLGAPGARDTEAERLILEVRQRNAIADAVARLKPARKDIVMISDIDEIPRGARVAELPARMTMSSVCPFIQVNHRGYINNRSTAALNRCDWVGSVACRYRLFLHADCQNIRMNYGAASRPLRGRFPGRDYIADGGWHLSSLGGGAATALKVQHMIHIGSSYQVTGAGGGRVPVQVFTGPLERDAARAAQAEYLARGGSDDFAPLEYDRFEIDQDLPAHLVAERHRFRRFFYFTDLK